MGIDVGARFCRVCIVIETASRNTAFATPVLGGGRRGDPSFRMLNSTPMHGAKVERKVEVGLISPTHTKPDCAGSPTYENRGSWQLFLSQNVATQKPERCLTESARFEAANSTASQNHLQAYLDPYIVMHPIPFKVCSEVFATQSSGL